MYRQGFACARFIGMAAAIAFAPSTLLAQPASILEWIDLKCYRIDGPPLNQPLHLDHLDPALQQMGAPPEDVVLLEPQQLCVPVAKNGAFPPPEVLALVQYVDLKCYHIEPQIPLNLPLRLDHLNPVLRELHIPPDDVVIVEPEQLCVPVAKNGMFPPPEVLPIVKFFDQKCYQIDPPIPPNFPLHLDHLDPVSQALGAPPEDVVLFEPQKLCVPVAKQGQLPPGFVDISFDQISFLTDGQPDPNTTWGAVNVISNVVQPMYFNLTVNGTWQIQDIFVMPADRETLSRREVLYFDLGVPDGTRVEQVKGGYSFTNFPLEQGPEENFSALVGQHTYTIDGGLGGPLGPKMAPTPLVGGFACDLPTTHTGSPNQRCGRNECVPTAVSNSLKWLKEKQGLDVSDDKISIDRLKRELDWTQQRGCDPDRWPQLKIDYMNAQGIAVRTTVRGNREQAYQDFKSGCDVELQTTPDAGQWGHAVMISEMSKTCDQPPKYTLKVYNCDQTTGNTSEETVTIDQNGALHGPGNWAEGQPFQFISECKR